MAFRHAPTSTRSHVPRDNAVTFLLCLQLQTVFLKNSKLITNGKIFAFEGKWKICDLPVMCTILEFQQLVLIVMGISDTFLTMDCELMKLCAGHVTD